jgi:HEAT repeat protein
MSTATLNEPAVRVLRKTLADPSAEVRIAAAETLCRIGCEKSALPVLIETLSHESPWVRLEAAGALDRVGEKARPAVAALRKAAADQGKENTFVRWVVNHTLSRLSE